MTQRSIRALLALLGATAFGASLAHAQIQVAAPEVGCEAGQTVSAAINVGSLTGQGVTGFDFRLTFDNTIARVSGASNNNTLSTGMSFVTNAKDTVIAVAAASANPMSGSGVLVNITVQCLGDGLSPLTFERFRFNAGSPVASLVHGSVGVAAAVPTAEVNVNNLDLGEIIRGRETSAAFSVVNSGTGQLSGSVRIVGDDPDAFELRAGDGEFSLGAGQTLNVEVALVSMIVGTKSAQIEITHNADNIESPILVPISGEVLLNTSTDAEELPREYVLGQNFPNPFNPQTSISFGLPAAGPVRIILFDLTGRARQILADGIFSAGWHSVEFSAAGLPSGTYIYRLEANGLSIARKMTVLK